MQSSTSAAETYAKLICDMRTSMPPDFDLDEGEMRCAVKGRTNLDGMPSKPVAKLCVPLDGGDLFIRVDCERNPSFWLEVNVDLAKLVRLLPDPQLLSLTQHALAATDERSKAIETDAKTSFEQAMQEEEKQ